MIRRWILLAALSALASAAPAPKPQPAATPSAPELSTRSGPERRLVQLRSQEGDVFAESDPSFDWTCYLPRSYRLQGIDPQVAAGAASRGGLPARLAGFFVADQVTVAPRLSESALLPLPTGARSPWRGVAALRSGGSEYAVLPGVWQPCLPPVPKPARDGLYRVSAWTQGSQLQLADATFVGPVPALPTWSGPVGAFVSEAFLGRSLDLIRAAHPTQFAWEDPTGSAGFKADRIGLTTVDGGLRCFARLSGEVTGFGTLVSGEWEAPLALALRNGYARLTLLPEGQRARLTRPVFAELPEQWSDTLLRNLAQWFDTGISLPVPGAYLQQLLQSGLVTQAELDALQLSAACWGDRRSGTLLMSTAPPPSNRVPAELGWAPNGFGLCLSATALNRCLATWIPAHLPLTIDLPAGAVPGPQILIFKLQIRKLIVEKLAMRYANGHFVIDNCQIAVGWALGPLSGVEPGARFGGWAEPALSGSPPRFSVRMHIDTLEFLSSHIKDQSAAEQAKIRAQIVDGLSTAPVPLPVDLQVLTPVSPTVPLQLTGMRGLPDRLWLLGEWGAAR